MVYRKTAALPLAAALCLCAASTAAANPVSAEGQEPGAEPVRLAELDLPPTVGTQLDIQTVAAEKPALIPVSADESSTGLRKAAERRRTRTLELVFQGLNAIDAVQTVTCIERGACSEMNPLLGSNPSAAKVIAFKAGGGLMHYGVTRYLQSNNPHLLKFWQYGSIAIMGGTVLWNAQFAF